MKSEMREKKRQEGVKETKLNFLFGIKTLSFGSIGIIIVKELVKKVNRR